MYDDDPLDSYGYHYVYGARDAWMEEQAELAERAALEGIIGPILPVVDPREDLGWDGGREA